MITISSHIEQLLRHHDCVILPSIGAFIASYKPAHINEEWGIITPPRREINFNASITNNDGLLANSIARKRGISFEAANIILQHEIDKLNSHLKNEKEFAIGKLGILHCGEEENLHFEHFKTDKQRNAFYGLYPFKMRTLAEIERELHPKAQFSENQQPQRSDKNYYIAINKQFAKYAAMFIVVFFAAISLSMPQGSDLSHSYDTASVLPIKKEVKQNVCKQISRDTSTPINTETVKPDTVSETAPIPTVDECYAVVATMTTREEAEKYVRLKKTDKSLQIITKGKMSRVYTHSGSRKEMATIITDRNFQKEFPGAWIWQPKR